MLLLPIKKGNRHGRGARCPPNPSNNPRMLWLRTQKIVSRDFRIGVAGPDSGAPRAVNKEEDLEEQDASRSGFRVSAESSGIMTRVPAQRAPQKAPLSHAVRFAGPFALSDVHFIGFDA